MVHAVLENIGLVLRKVFFVNPVIKWTIVTFPLTYNLLPFLSIFSVLNSSWLVFCSSFSENVPINPSTLRSSYVHGTVFLTFLIIKYFLDQCIVEWSVSFSKNIFVIWNSYMITNLEFRIFIINFLPESIYVLSLSSF